MLYLNQIGGVPPDFKSALEDKLQPIRQWSSVKQEACLQSSNLGLGKFG
ncbi:hypothetical protein [Dapis sp. BLCC M229]